MKFAVCNVPVAHMRLLPDHRQELTSQFLFGERGTVVESRKDGWALIQHQWDGYMGWCRMNQFDLSENEPLPPAMVTSAIMSDLRISGTAMNIPLGSVIDPELQVAGDVTTISLQEQVFSRENVIKFSNQFLNTGYLWGGRSIFGIDCSAFVQSVYRLMNIHLLRDAKMQVSHGEVVGFLQEAECGDLAFFEEEGEIMHVGILLNDHEIIHASGKVRIDAIDSAGIVNSTTGQRTHQMRIIKRLV